MDYFLSLLPGLVYVISGHSINSESQSISSSHSSFPCRPGFLVDRFMHKSNFFERLWTISDCCWGFLGRASQALFRLLSLTALLENEDKEKDSKDSFVWLFSLKILSWHSFYFPLCIFNWISFAIGSFFTTALWCFLLNASAFWYLSLYFSR